ncbi:LysR substrate-binding domain-containing protein [Rhizobium calliandrae]|uniref:LysR substrate-binding domain-containing protein n=1 Tax=Rhizobium calliandrae TaxID=1312182 RepID=A0ABT7KKM2_9HYPH|nr:LysR substrate-binding domain-containing protein [Rhizobium calliandrae]MDL2407813.1 LysR substrate-binding domain-containing protein [Rhizobium calliandrae]
MVRSRRGLELAELDRTFTLLGADFFSMLLMPRLSREVSWHAPNVRLRLLDSALGDVARLLQKGGIDMALERPLEVPDWISSRLLFKSPFVLIASSGNQAVAALPENEAMPMETFCALPHALRSIDGSMSGMVDNALAATGLRRRVTLALPHFQAVALAVSSGQHIAAVPSQFAAAVRHELKLRVFAPPLDIPVPDVRLYWHARHDQDAAHRWMREKVMETVEELGWGSMPRKQADEPA